MKFFAKMLCVFLALCLLAGMLPSPALAADAEIASGSCGVNLTWVLDGDGTLTISGTGEMENYSLSQSAPWSSIKSSIKTVVISEGVTAIGDYAFRSCSELVNVTIPETVTSIGGSTFSGCIGLTSAGPIGGGYAYEFGWKTSIPNNAFRRCSELTSVTIPETVTSIGNSAFSGCSGLTSAGPIGGGYTYEFGWKTSIPNNAFRSCSELTSVMIPETVTSIGDYAFYDCSRLTSVTIPATVTSIGDYAFYGCSGLTSVAIPETVTSIGSSAFYDCIGLTSFTVPEGITSIGEWAFWGCNGLTSAGPIGGDYAYEFGWKTLIPSHAFDGCAGLTSVMIPETVTSIGDYAFDGCSGLTSVTIPKSVTSIGAGTFNDCSGLTSVTIPETVTSIGNTAFWHCSGLTSAGPIGGEYDYQFGWKTAIPVYAFYGCNGLTSVTIPDGVTSIWDSAFRDCNKLTSVTIPESVTYIGNEAFGFSKYSPDFYIYCYPSSYAENYAIKSRIKYMLLNRGDDEISAWFTSNAPSGVVAGTEFMLRTGYSPQNPASSLQIDLPNGLTLSKSSIWLDGKELTADSYTLTNSTLTVSLTGLPGKPAHTLYLYCTATAAGSYSVSGTLTLKGAEQHSLGTTVIQVDQARLNVPEKVGYTDGIIATGKTNSGCGVTLFVDGALAGSATANEAGSWHISFDLGAGAESGSVHTVYAEIQLANGDTVRTADASVTYQACDVKPVKITMYNTGDHGAQETVFGFTKPEEANLVRYYRIWPSRYPSFTFKAEFSGDPSTLSGVSILTTDSAGNETKVPAVYDRASHSWVGTFSYSDFQNAPVWVRVVYSADEISSNRLSAVPIMDPSGYVYEAVPSNRLSGVTATIFSAQDGGDHWNANAFDQLNPQTTGADGSYYWDVPAGSWKVSFSKAGYTAASTDWLTVPPPQVDINVAMVSTAAPEVKYAAVYPDYAEITFSQYMDIDSVKNAITLNNVTAAVEALDAEYNADKTASYATRFKATAAELAGQVELKVGSVSNYAGTAMQGTYTQTFSVETRPTGITAPETVSMEMSAGKSIRAELNPGISGRILTIENLTPAIISVSAESATTGEDGSFEISVNALLPGAGLLRITEPLSGLEATVSVGVKAGAETKISSASINGGTLSYSVDASGGQNAQLIVAGYDNQRMSSVQRVAVAAGEGTKLSGTLELTDLSADSYVLFLVEPGTMKPLCPKVTVSAA